MSPSTFPFFRAIVRLVGLKKRCRKEKNMNEEKHPTGKRLQLQRATQVRQKEDPAWGHSHPFYTSTKHTCALELMRSYTHKCCLCVWKHVCWHTKGMIYFEEVSELSWFNSERGGGHGWLVFNCAEMERWDRWSTERGPLRPGNKDMKGFM